MELHRRFLCYNQGLFMKKLLGILILVLFIASHGQAKEYYKEVIISDACALI